MQEQDVILCIFAFVMPTLSPNPVTNKNCNELVKNPRVDSHIFTSSTLNYSQDASGQAASCEFFDGDNGQSLKKTGQSPGQRLNKHKFLLWESFSIIFAYFCIYH